MEAARRRGLGERAAAGARLALGMSIRPVEPADFAAIAAMTNYYIERTTIHFGLAPVTAEELRAGWESHPRHPYLVHEDERGEVVAYAKAGVWRERAAYGHTAEVGVYVRHGLQRRGLGRGLYEALIGRCRAAGFHALVGGITLPNEASVRLHEACGFVRVGTFREVGRKFDEWHDVGFWQLML